MVIGHCPFISAAAPDEPPKPHPDVQALIEKGEQVYQAYKFDDALQLFNEALAKARAPKDKAGEALTLNDIGVVYWSIGRPPKALEYLGQALPLIQETEGKGDDAVLLTKLLRFPFLFSFENNSRTPQLVGDGVAADPEQVRASISVIFLRRGADVSA